MYAYIYKFVLQSDHHTVCMYISYNFALKEPQNISVSSVDTNMYLKWNKKQNFRSMCDEKLGLLFANRVCMKI